MRTRAVATEEKGPPGAREGQLVGSSDAPRNPYRQPARFPRRCVFAAPGFVSASWTRPTDI